MDMNLFFFGVYPYIAGTVFLLGSLLRFDREQYLWRSESSQLLRTGTLRWGSNLFHVGIIGLFFGHLFGLLTPLAVFEALGLTPHDKQIVAMATGGTLGLLILIGLVLLIARRLGEPRLRATTRPMDWVTLFWILATLLLGLSTIAVSAQHTNGREMLLLMSWAKSIVTFQGGAAAGYIATASPIFKVHIVFGLTLFLLFPFTRLVHVWSGIGTVAYLARPWQLVRTRR
ncbi:respiratory nitrate reductase subunit gamma [Metallibacterium sp.]|uniref:respiratory nitrate reductase subunit gamma n=1 Tax=Metallibacterium sp. TaxID=2940281 RepID=UPI00261D4D47|nr:respiratory nitrate reductase subunit gamma [Metallibacterium sp.]